MRTVQAAPQPPMPADPAAHPTIALAAALAALRARLAASEHAAHRPCASVRLLAVSKGVPVPRVRAAWQLGQVDFGENYVQELAAKAAAAGPGPRWHFIGTLQSNKSALVARHCAWLHSLDRLRLARRLDAQRPAGAPPLQVLLQVRLDGPAGRRGVPPEQLAELACEVARLPRLRLRGLMVMPAAPPEARGALFQRLRECLEELRRQGLERLDTLSMGTSGDLEAAVTAGATWVRIGTALFGPRPAPPARLLKSPP